MQRVHITSDWLQDLSERLRIALGQGVGNVQEVAALHQVFNYIQRYSRVVYLSSQTPEEDFQDEYLKKLLKQGTIKAIAVSGDDSGITSLTQQEVPYHYFLSSQLLEESIGRLTKKYSQFFARDYSENQFHSITESKHISIEKDQLYNDPLISLDAVFPYYEWAIIQDPYWLSESDLWRLNIDLLIGKLIKTCKHSGFHLLISTKKLTEGTDQRSKAKEVIEYIKSKYPGIKTTVVFNILGKYKDLQHDRFILLPFHSLRVGFGFNLFKAKKDTDSGNVSYQARRTTTIDLNPIFDLANPSFSRVYQTLHKHAFKAYHTADNARWDNSVGIESEEPDYWKRWCQYVLHDED